MHDMFSKVDANVAWYNYYIPPPVYKSHLQLNAEPHSYLHVHVCGNALHIGTQCLICMSNSAQESPTV